MATTAQKVPTNVPAPGVPLTDADGNVTPVWFLFFQTLQNRTGSNAGIPIDYVQAEVLNLLVEGAMAIDSTTVTQASDPYEFSAADTLWADDPAPKPPFTPALDTLWAEDAQKPPQPLALAFDTLWNEEPPRPINPFLAALFIGDA